jgi:isocitrate dehydrogenase kinase/phosphatase
MYSASRAYFMVDWRSPAVVDFLFRPSCKTKADIYTALGLWKQGKTEFYRDFLHHLSTRAMPSVAARVPREW